MFPTYVAEGNLPVGVQVIAPFGEDAKGAGRGALRRAGAEAIIPVIPGRAQREPGIILPIVVMDSGPAPSGASRNDSVLLLPDPPFGAGLQPLDVFAVRPEQQQRQHRKQR